MPDAGEGTDLEAERAALRERHLGVLVDRIDADLRRAAGTAALDDLVRELDELAADLPLREDVAALRMRALLDAGRPTQALLAYEKVRLALAETLGADPSRALRDLHLEALRQDAPPAAAPTTLRRSVTSFVGRDDDLLALTRRLARDRLVTLTGAGGSGKTRLATETAARVLDRAAGSPPAPDGVWFVELAPVTDPADLTSAVLEGLGIRDVAERTGLESAVEPRRLPRARERLLEWLAGRECLVVLDNCEHLVAAAADLAADVLTRAPGVRLLATSREPLGVDGEAVHPLSPLAVPPEGADDDEVLASPAVRLLLDRAAAAGADVPRTSVDDLAAIVRRLDGLPLALELAAARLRLLSPSEVAARLDDRFRLLTGGRRTAVPRHRTLRAVVEWSWDLLTDVEREVADHFCVFPGGATPAGVAAVCPSWRDSPDADVSEVTDVLQGLVDKSLLVADHGPEGTRLRMLETLREYGAERLAAWGLGEAAHDAAARHTTALVVRTDALLRGAGQVRALHVLDAERENVAYALAHLVDRQEAGAALELVQHLGWYWLLREQAEDAIRWTGAALRLPGALADPAAPAVRALRVAVAATLPGVEPADAGQVDGLVDSFVAAADALRGTDELLPAAAGRPPAAALLRRTPRRGPAHHGRAGRQRPGSLGAGGPQEPADRRRRERGRSRPDALGRRRRRPGVGGARRPLGSGRGSRSTGATAHPGRRPGGGGRRLRGGAAPAAHARHHVRRPDDAHAAGGPAAACGRPGGRAGARRGHAAEPFPGELETMRDVLADVADAAIALRSRTATRPRAPASGCAARCRRRHPARSRRTRPLSGTPRSPPWRSRPATARPPARHVRRGLRAGVRTNDLPILATVGVSVATVALARRDGPWPPPNCSAPPRACAAPTTREPLRAPGDRRGPAPGGEQVWDDAYGRGRAMSRAGAIARLDPDGHAPGSEDGTAGADRAVGAGQARRR